MRDNPEDRVPKSFPEKEAKPLSALEQIAQNGLLLRQQPDRDEPHAKSASASAAAAVRDKNAHIEALEQQQTLLEKRIQKLQRQLADQETDATEATELKSRIDEMKKKRKGIDAEIDALWLL